MTQADSSSQFVLVCLQRDAGLLRLPLEHRLVRSTDDLCIYDVSVAEQAVELRESARKLSGFTLRRYLDRFYLLVPDDAAEKRQEILDGFFNIIGADYESFIDVSRNVDNIRNLLSFVSQLIVQMRGETIVDYGCGTGLSLSPASEFGVSLIGVDRSSTMCRIARSKGMTALTLEELAEVPTDQISAAFASYVFHLRPETDGLRLLWTRLRKGGVFVANFHKNEGMDNVNNCVSELGGVIKQLKAAPGYEKHGAYVAYIKS